MVTINYNATNVLICPNVLDILTSELQITWELQYVVVKFSWFFSLFVCIFTAPLKHKTVQLWWNQNINSNIRFHV